MASGWLPGIPHDGPRAVRQESWRSQCLWSALPATLRPNAMLQHLLRRTGERSRLVSPGRCQDSSEKEDGGRDPVGHARPGRGEWYRLVRQSPILQPIFVTWMYPLRVEYLTPQV